MGWQTYSIVDPDEASQEVFGNKVPLVEVIKSVYYIRVNSTLHCRLLIVVLPFCVLLCAISFRVFLANWTVLEAYRSLLPSVFSGSPD